MLAEGRIHGNFFETKREIAGVSLLMIYPLSLQHCSSNENCRATVQTKKNFVRLFTVLSFIFWQIKNERKRNKFLNGLVIKNFKNCRSGAKDFCNLISRFMAIKRSSLLWRLFRGRDRQMSVLLRK